MEAQGWKKPPRKLPKYLQPHQNRKSHIKKIAKWIDPKNPLTISETARRLGMSPWYVRNILRNILDVYQVKKRRVQELTDKQKAQREKFLKKYLTRRKLKFLFTMDEMMIRTSDLQRQMNFYYKGRRVIVPESMRQLPRKNWPEQVLMAMEFVALGNLAYMRFRQ